jgi:hypothetical protein
MKFLHRRENDPKRVAKNSARALEAANGPSLAPKGYKSDESGRRTVEIGAQRRIVSSIPFSTDPNAKPTVSHKKAYEESAKANDTYLGGK